MEEKKTTIWSIISKIMAISAFLGVMGVAIGGFIEYGKNQEADKNWRENLKALIFDDSKQADDVKELLDIEYHPVKQMRQSDTLIIQQKSLGIQLETSIKSTETQNIKLDSMKVESIKRNVKDSIDEIRRVKSRNARNYKMDVLLENQSYILERLKKMDTINN